MLNERLVAELTKMRREVVECTQNVSALTSRLNEVEKELHELKETLVEGAVILPDDFPK